MNNGNSFNNSSKDSSTEKLTQSSRTGDRLPLEQLASYLEQYLPTFIQNGNLHVEQFSGGASNLTYRLSSHSKSLILRRPPFGTKAKSAHDMAREFNVISKVSQHYSYAPKPVLLCEEVNIIGDKFFLMQEIAGLGIDKNLPVEMDNHIQKILCHHFIDALLELHKIDITIPEIAQLGKPEGYAERQLTGWYQRYLKAKTNNVRSADHIYTWLDDHLPRESGLVSVIHNDFKFDNLILNPNRPQQIIGVLDWEMATLGDPLMDLGCSLAYWVQSNDGEKLQAIRMMPTHLKGMLTREQLVQRYFDSRNIPPVNFKPYYVFGLFRLAVIAQQIYFRFHNGQTDNPKFKEFMNLVNILLEKCSIEIDRA